MPGGRPSTGRTPFGFPAGLFCAGSGLALLYTIRVNLVIHYGMEAEDVTGY
jgi:hypothetical protein